MARVIGFHIVLFSLFFTYIGEATIVKVNREENKTDIHGRRHYPTLDNRTGNSDGPRKERFPSNLEYRLVRMEVQFIEKFDRINSEIRENNNRLQNLELQYAETQRSVDGALPLLASYLRQQPHQQQQRHQSTSQSSVAATIDDRLNKLAEATANLIATSRVFYRDLDAIKGNLSSIAATTKNIYDGSHHFVTSSTLNKALMSVRSSPTCTTSKLVPQCNGSRNYPANCLEVLNGNRNIQSGIYQIRANPGADPIMVYCDMATAGGGWTVIQRRYDGSQDFYRPWLEYKQGFGNIGGEFWLGLDNIHDLTGADVNELLVELEDQDGVGASARYGAFSVGGAAERYRLRVLAGHHHRQDGTATDVYDERFSDSSSRATGNTNNDAGIEAGDSLSYHAGSRFSTFDVDEDNWPEGSCAQSHGGGWWYNQCDRSNLNGRYLQTGDPLLPDQLAYQGMYWHTFHGPRYNLRGVRMLVRPTVTGQPPHHDDPADMATTTEHTPAEGTQSDSAADADDEVERNIANIFGETR